MDGAAHLVLARDRGPDREGAVALFHEPGVGIGRELGEGLAPGLDDRVGTGILAHPGEDAVGAFEAHPLIGVHTCTPAAGFV